MAKGRFKQIKCFGEPVELAEKIFEQSKQAGRAISMQEAYNRAILQLNKANKQLPTDWGFKL